MTLRTNYVATGDPLAASEMDATNTQINANTVDIATLKLNPIAKTANYTLVASDFVICDASGGAFTITLPTTPTDRTRAAVIKMDSSVNAVTVATGGADRFQITGGASTEPLSTQFTLIVLQYNSSSGIWYILNSKSVYLSNVDNTSDVTKNAAAVSITNHRIVQRVNVSNAPSSPTTLDADSYDQHNITGLAVALTINAPSGTPNAGQPLLIRIKDNGTARALTWNSIFRTIGVTLPTTTVISKTHYIGCRYNSTDSKWDVLAVGAEA